VTDPLLPIDQVAKLAGVTASALRYYERRGLISEGVRLGGRRHYHTSVLHRLSAIRTFKLIGFSLADIDELLDIRAAASAWRAIIAARRDEVQNQIVQLHRLITSQDSNAGGCGDRPPCRRHDTRTERERRNDHGHLRCGR
jgi:MerR family redox-sensitive transcriptional activator SoxR